MRFSKERIAAALNHLRRADPVMRGVIRKVGPFTLKPMRHRFEMLVRSIISQQISTKAAKAIRLRLMESLKPGRATPENLVRRAPHELRAVGLSAQKSAYLLDLSQKVLDGSVELSQIGRCSDEEVIERLIQVKGIGRWTAQMFLIFSLGRLDVFPHDDLGIRTALRNLYRLDALPDKATSEEIAAAWRPYASVASWYCWRSGDLALDEKSEAKEYPV